MTTKNHDIYNLALNDKDMMPVIAYGSAGTGKTYGAMGRAAKWLEEGRKQKIVMIRPNVAFADTLGFLPGDAKEKLEPWIKPFRQNLLAHGITISHQQNLEANGTISYLPLEHVQGLTFDNTFICVDECENMTFEQIKMVLTRVGKWSKVVFCGDIAQTSPRFKKSGLKEYIEMVEHFDAPIHTIEFTHEDILRSELCKQVIIMHEEWERFNG